MSKCDIERNAEISMMRKEGATFKEIAEWYEISTCRAQQICTDYSDGNTKEEIIQNWERKQEEKRKQKEAWETEYKEWSKRRSGGKEYAIMNGDAEVFLTEITGEGYDRMYRYGTKDIKKALFFTLEEAKRIARERKAVVCWVP